MFFKSCIFEKCNIPWINDVTMSQLLTIDKHQLYDDENKENMGLEQTKLENGIMSMQGILKIPI
jgi:hypothetical protein